MKDKTKGIYFKKALIVIGISSLIFSFPVCPHFKFFMKNENHIMFSARFCNGIVFSEWGNFIILSIVFGEIKQKAYKSKKD